MKIHNYSAGPCVLPKSVMEKAAESVVNYNNTGLSIIEMSHRSKDFVAVMDNAVSLVKELLNIPEGYEVLFLQGGASMQFYMSALNFLPEEGKAAYINTGTCVFQLVHPQSYDLLKMYCQLLFLKLHFLILFLQKQDLFLALHVKTQ